MKLFLVRHGETEHNVAQLLAGATDSRLTSHGKFQAGLLGAHLVSRGLKFTHFFASDLQRARMTAQAIADAQQNWYDAPAVEVLTYSALREQDFGSNELVPWASKKGQDSFFDRTPDVSAPGHVPKESVQALKARAREFIEEEILPLFASDDTQEHTVAIVSHGLFLGVLWRDLLGRFGPGTVSVDPNAVGNDYGAHFSPLEHIGIWANTAYLEVEIHRSSTKTTPPNPQAEPSSSTNAPALPHHRMNIKNINSHTHTQGYRKQRGGLGNVPHDPKQKDIKVFFTKKTAEHENAVETGEVLESALDAEIDAQTMKDGEGPMGGVLR
jgi:broad specificity phosphatase PhoE